MRFEELKPEWVRPYPTWIFLPHYMDASTFEKLWKQDVGNYLGINVWNCQASLVLIKLNPDYTIEQENIEDVPKEIEDLMIECIEEQGGAINMSGTYRPCPKLIDKIKELLGVREDGAD